MKKSKWVFLIILAINFGQNMARAWESDFVERSYNDRGEDLDSTYILSVGPKCAVEYEHDGEGDPRFYSYCFTVTYEKLQNNCTGVIDPNGKAHIWGNHDRYFWSKEYCTESAAVYNNEGKSLSILCNNWRKDAISLMKSSEEKKRKKHKCQ
jgi:hypothetical protein